MDDYLMMLSLVIYQLATWVIGNNLKTVAV